MEWRRGGYEISTDPQRLDLDLTHRFLSEEAYWSPGVPREVVQRAIDGSIVFGLYHDGKQVGMTRVVTDRATFAWVCDVFVLADERGKGLGKWLMECVKSHPDLQGLRRWLLATSDAHGLYAQYGFTPVDPQRFMEIRDPDVYQRRGN
ncbi:MAG TPA: GNAT family N-acetyltransferase [Candidatus Limnocylindrales bacterium]